MPTSSDIAVRNFGKTDVKISAIACGGHHLGDPQEQKIAMQIVEEAIDGGITFDNCWEYHRGKCEEWLGRSRDYLRHDHLMRWRIVERHRPARRTQGRVERASVAYGGR
jgi:predicted aldo/keto reductase-like oxidoreductase